MLGKIIKYDMKAMNRFLIIIHAFLLIYAFFIRILTWLVATLQIFFLLLWKYRHYRVVYVTNPPMSYFPSLILKHQYSVIVYDVYPDALSNIGVYQDSWIYKVWAKIIGEYITMLIRYIR